jgi:signal transduction histidine kinase
VEPRWRPALADALARASTVPAVIDVLLDQASSLTRASGVLLALRDPRTGTLRLVAGRGETGRLMDGREALAADAAHPMAEAARSGLASVHKEGALRELWPSLGEVDRYEGLAVLAVAPLLVDRDVVAVLALQFARGRVPAPSLLDRLATITALSGNALDRAQLGEAARAAAEAKSAFLTMMSHELRTPLNAIMGYTGLLADEVVGPLNETQRDQLHRVQSQARHLLGLIEELLSLTSAEGGPSDLQFERVVPAALVEEVLQLLAPTAERKGLRLEWHTPAPLAPLVTDADKVRQVLAHLLGNAVKFTAAGMVEAEVREVGEGAHRAVEFIVRDTGPGIPPQDMERLFEPFWQGARSHAQRAAGTGLGLHVARRFARLLGGDILVDSHPGEGSTFILRLPARED